MRSAVLLVVFNRPEHTARAFARIREMQPPKLYVAADGPRAGRADEAERCAAVRRIATAVDWPCELHTLFQPENRGCKLGVAGGIDWFFAHEEEGIIIEDDILPDPTFFRYCDTLLERHRGDERVALISGANLVPAALPGGASYRASRYLHIWGWASWRRAWSKYDVTAAGWGTPAARRKLHDTLNGRSDAIRYWAGQFDAVAAGRIDTWDYQWILAAWLNDMVALMPDRNLIENIGFGADATHTVGEPTGAFAAMRIAPMTFPLVDPATLVPDPDLDRQVEAIYRFPNRIGHLRKWVGGIPAVRTARRLLSSPGTGSRPSDGRTTN